MELKTTLFHNDYKTPGDKQPDFRSGKNFEINGVKHQIAAWKRDEFKGKKANVFIKAGLGYKENGAVILDIVCTVDEVINKPNPKMPDYSTVIKLGGVPHDIALWLSEKGHLSLSIKEKGSRTAAVPQEQAFEADPANFLPYEANGVEDDLPF